MTYITNRRINIRTIRNIAENDGLTLRNGKIVRYKTGWQVGITGIECRTPEEVTAINLDITNIKKLVGTIPEGATATDIVNYIKELVDAEKARATGVESGLDTRLSAVETLVGEGGSVDDKIATAKQEAIDAAATDATTKANTAETNAKTYADGLNTAMDTRVASIESKVGEGFEPISESFIRGLFA